MPPFDHPRHLKSGVPPATPEPLRAPGELWKFCNVEPRLDRENDLARLHFRCALTVKSWLKSSYYNLKYVE